MKDYYNVNNLYYGYINITRPYGSNGPLLETSNNIFIVEKNKIQETISSKIENKKTLIQKLLKKDSCKIIEEKNIKTVYNEIFTMCQMYLDKSSIENGFSFKYFNEGYIVDEKKLIESNLLTSKEIRNGVISKYRLSKIYNNLNKKKKIKKKISQHD